MIAANSRGEEIGGLVVVPTRGEPVDRRAMCSGDHTLCGQGLRSLHDGHQIVGSNGPSIAVLSPIWTWCLCRYQMVLEVAAWPLLCGQRAGRVVNWADSSFHSLSIFLFGLRVGCERFHVVVLLRGGVEKKRREGQTVSSQRPCHVSHSSQRNRWTPLAFPKTASTSVLSQLRHVPCPSWHLHHNSTLFFPRHGMKCSLHIPPPIFLPSRQARKGPPLPVFPWLHDGCFCSALVALAALALAPPPLAAVDGPPSLGFSSELGRRALA